MPVLQVPSGEEGGPGGLPSLLKEEEREEDEEEKKVDGDDEEEMEGKRRDEEDMHDSLVVEEGKIVKLNNHIGETNLMDYDVLPKAQDLLPLATLPFARIVQPLWQELLKKVKSV